MGKLAYNVLRRYKECKNFHGYKILKYISKGFK